MTPTLPPPRSPHGYHPYIDGLRALAVLAVLVFHLHAAWLPGGFVGVDVFFVISGFVVSASVAHFQGRGLLQFLGYFYARRIKRIFPALVVCLLVTAYATALFVPQSWLGGVNQQTGLYAFFGLSNFILVNIGRDYFAPTTEFNPYTHTWSLAVEEQFYVLFPLLFLAWLLGRKGRGVSTGLFAVLAMGSMVYGAWQTATAPLDAYFLTPGRLWELALGVLLFQLTHRRAEHVGPATPVRAVFGWLSLALLVGALVFTPRAHFPFPGALPAVLGTLGVMFFLHRQPQLRALHGLLGSRALVAVGRISYSLYLWHWPVFTLMRWTVGLEGPLHRSVAVLLAFALAVLSYRLIETPVRRARLLNRAPQLAVIAVGALVVGGGAWTVGKIVENQYKISLSVLSSHTEDWYPHSWWYAKQVPGCLAEPQYQDVEGGLLAIYKPFNCVTPPQMNPHKVFVIGDSHAMAYEGMFKQFAMRSSIEVLAYNNGGCPFVGFQPWRENDDPRCHHYKEAALKDIRQRIQPGDVLFLPSLRLARLSDQWAYFGEANAAKAQFGRRVVAARKRALADGIRELREFSERGVQIVLEAPKPLFGAPPFRCADWFNRGNPICAPGFTVSRSLLETYRQPILNAFARIESKVPGVSVWDPFPVLCPDEQCQAFRDGKPLFLDGDHLSGNGNLLLLQDFTEFMAKRLVGLDSSKTEVAYP